MFKHIFFKKRRRFINSKKGECKLDIIDSVGTLVIKIKKLKTNLIADDSETDETIIMHKVSI
jgi:hypothetical protein